MSDISYKNYGKNLLMVKCESDKHLNFLKSIDSSQKKENLWVVNKSKEPELKNYINSILINKSFSINNTKINIRSRKLQKKYHRAMSDNESESENENENENENESDKSVSSKESTKSKLSVRDKDIEVKIKTSPVEKELLTRKKLEEKEKFEKEKLDFEKSQKDKIESQENPLKYYKNFNKKPVDFKKINNYSDSEDDRSNKYSSSSRSSNSSDESFPSPKTPKKRKNYFEEDKNDYSELLSEMKKLQKKLYEIEIENKKLKNKKM